MSLNNKYCGKTQYTITIDQPFFNMEFKVTDGGSDNADIPVNITFDPEQWQGYEFGKKQEIEFYGPLEFAAFRVALRALDTELEKIFGPPQDQGWCETVSVIRTPVKEA